MTDYQLDKILRMIAMILDGCRDLDEAKQKVAALLDQPSDTSAEEVK